MRQSCLLLCLLPLLCTSQAGTASEFTSTQLRDAFAQSSGGYSSDELLITDELRDGYLKRLSPDQELTVDQERTVLLKLLQLRKSGNLNVSATRRGKPVAAEISPIAEIASRVVADRHRVTTDTILADRTLRNELQAEAEKILPEIDAYDLRKSVLQLRKKRALKPELVLRVADWDREIRTITLEDLRGALQAQEIPRQPGIYLFRSDEGYLYIGEAVNLETRLQQHLSTSDRQSLAEYLASDEGEQVTVELHIFPSDSPAKKISVRRAYESELIRSRNPKFNVRP